MRSLGILFCLTFVTALGACGGDDGNSAKENCSTPGDEDGNGLSDCADPACATTPACVAHAVCGNNIKEEGEDCDDGNTASGDGCSSTCKTEACGNGVVDAGEGCDDGNTVNGDACDNNCMVPGCGNGIMEGTEECDDGNTVSGDGCDNNCKNTACGNGVMTTGEACDDGNNVDGDGCDSNCTVTACGNGIITGTEECDDGNTSGGDSCSPTCTIVTCGNGVLNGTEVCDDGNFVDGDGCDTNCTPTACGNGVISGTTGETCDDSNTANGDGCSSACRAEVSEIEPNEDGMPDIGADFAGTDQNDVDATAIMNADNNGAFDAANGEVHILAALSPAGDEDVFKISNSTAVDQVVQLDIWNLDPAFGFGVPCGTSIDTVMRLYDNTATDLGILNDDRNGAADRCSTLAVIFPAGATAYDAVSFYDDNVEVPAPGYALQIRFTPFVCGDGIHAPGEACDDGNLTDGDGCDSNCTVTACGNGIPTTGEACDDGNTVNGDGCDNNCTVTACGNNIATTGEQCDDGNLVNGDGCSSTCHVEGLLTEVEPNDTTAQADANAVQITGDIAIQGAIPATTDVDVYRMVITTGTVVRAETMTALNPEDCVGGTQDLVLLDSTGTTIIQDTGAVGGGIGLCGGVDIFLAPGTYYLRVKNTAITANYFLKVDYETDDGAESEAANTMGVNDVQATASTNFGTPATLGAFVFGDHTLQADSDWYAVSVPNGARIRAEVVEGNRATTTCESNHLDSELTLYDQTGTQLVTDDDDGRGFCSMIDGRGTTPLYPAAKNSTGATQTWYLQVRQSHTITGVTTDGQFTYRLSVDIH